MTTLYEHIGGAAALDLFYVKVMADTELTPFFTNTNMEQQRKKQRTFLMYALGGTPHYNGRSMREAHANAVAQGLNEHHFNRVATHLSDTLHELNVPEDLITQVMTIAASTKADVLNQ